MNLDEQYVSRCIQLANNGLGKTYPNPLVGAVVVHNHQIIGEGWHQKAGESHAEIIAINAVKNKALLQESTLYVSLEPCSHFGKTPPCVHTIVAYKIPKVVVGTSDINPIVSGKGIQYLRDNGVEVIENIREHDCILLNKRFFTFQAEKRPYIILKWAKSNDNYIDTKRPFPTVENAKGTAISHCFTNQLVHKWRSEEQAILVGKNTVLKDNPQLNVRHWKGNEPYKIIIDKKLTIPQSYAILKAEKLLIFNAHKEIIEENKQYITVDFNQEIFDQIFSVLYDMNIQTIIIEGGKNVLEQLIRLSLWDEARIITNTHLLLQKGVVSPNIQGKIIDEFLIKKDKIQLLRNIANHS